jgi:hypothetical protein
MARMQKRIEIKALMNKFFAYIDNSKNESIRLQSMVECKNETESRNRTHYKWWGDDRYEPV